VRILTAGGPIDIFPTWAFRVGIESGDIPLSASVSLFMLRYSPLPQSIGVERGMTAVSVS
jgi:hypothetical protein